MQKIFSNFLDYIFYKQCYFCKKKANKNIICDKCYEKIRSNGYKKVKIINGIRVVGYYFYKEEIQALIRGIKYHAKREFAQDIAHILVELIGKQLFSENKTEIIPVPLHYKRQKKRKYNHMELISREISLLTGCNTNINLITRIKNTWPQYKLNQEERRNNLKNAFKVQPEFYSGKKIILFDDISTTGVTMEVLIQELKKHEIKNILGLVIAFA